MMAIDIPTMYPGLVEAIEQVESCGNGGAIGDHHLKDKAYGCLQIRQPYLDDAALFLGKRYRAEEMLNNRELSIKALNAYMSRYATLRQLGHEPTAQDIARIHNGGPTGWKRPTTEAYWQKVRQHYKE